jgi:hypothetical protein
MKTQTSESSEPREPESTRLIPFPQAVPPCRAEALAKADPPRSLRKSRGRIARHPEPIRHEINRKLRDAWSYPMICDWLFAQTADADVPPLRLKAGDPYSLVWTRGAKDLATAQLNFRCRLSKWYQRHYPTWLREQTDREEITGLVDRMENLSTAAGEKAREGSASGGSLLIRSLLIDAIDLIRKGNNDPANLARLANAWARINHSGLELEKFKLQSQKAIDVGLSALLEDAKHKPEAIIAFNKFHDIVKGKQKPSS